MTQRKPPKLAEWLLKAMGIAAGNAPLAGDLLEEFENGKPAAWFWRQTRRAVAVEVGRRARAARSVFLAYAMGFAAQAGIAFLLSQHGWPRQLQGRAWVTGIVIFCAWAAATCWMLWRWRRRRKAHPELDANEWSLADVTVMSLMDCAVYLTLYVVASLFERASPSDWMPSQAILLVIGAYNILSRTGRLARPARRRGGPRKPAL